MLRSTMPGNPSTVSTGEMVGDTYIRMRPGDTGNGVEILTFDGTRWKYVTPKWVLDSVGYEVKIGTGLVRMGTLRMQPVYLTVGGP